MMGVDPADPNTHVQYNWSQGYPVQPPPMCINRATCPGLRHYYPQCPNIQSDEEYFATWADWAYKKEAIQQA